MTPSGVFRSGRERGSAFAFVLILVFAMLSLTIAGLSGARFGLRGWTNYRTGMQAFLAAEAGALHAQSVIDDMGVVRFDTDVVTPWSTLFGTATRAIPGYPTVQYSVSAAADASNPAEFASLTVVGRAPGESQRTIVARLRRDDVFSPGAIYLPNTNSTTNFSGNAFLIDGNDTNLDGQPSGNPPVPGVGTASTQAAANASATLSSGQIDNVVGAGGMPSVANSAGPALDRINGTIIPNILSRPGVVTNPVLNGNDTFGTIANPQITHFTGNVTINGDLDGAGILIVDGSFTISGNATFTGLIIARGSTQITAVQGDTTILGALWTTELSMTVSGSASVTYSTEALRLANAIQSGDLVPQRVKAVAWNEL